MTEVQTTKRNHNNFAGIIDVDDFSTFLPNKKRTNSKMLMNTERIFISTLHHFLSD